MMTNNSKNKSQTKLSWGTGILLSGIVFITASIITGITFMNQKVDLVTDNYYEKELKYQNHIDRLNRTETLKDKIDIQVSGNSVKVTFSDSISVPIEGEINFYRPSDSAKDFVLPILLDENRRQLVSTEKIAKGFWKIQINWSHIDQEYYFEKSLLIN